MYRLLIVDDEENIVDGLYELFNSLTHLELDVFRAYTGSQAMDYLNTIRIDIVLSDIQMPRMNGLQLLENIHKCWPDCKVIFLTGYEQFDYLYTAMQNKCVDYILKTEKDSKIIEAVERAINIIEQSYKSNELINKAREHINSAMPLLQREYLTELLCGEKNSIPSQQQLDELEIPLKVDETVIMLIACFNNLSKKLSSVEKAKLIYSIKLTVEEHLFMNCDFTYVLYENSYMVWLIQPSSQTSRQKAILFIKETLEIVQRICMESFNACLSFAIGKESYEWGLISNKYCDLMQLLYFSTGSENGVIVTGSDQALFNEDGIYTTMYNDGNTQNYLKKIDSMGDLLEKGQREDFFELFEEVTQKLIKTRNMHFVSSQALYFTLSLMFLTYIDKFKCNERIAFKIGIYPLTKIDEFDTWSDAVKYLRRMAEIIFELQNNFQENRSKNVVLKVQKYIDEHLSEIISLTAIAEAVFFNPFYLSRVFRQVVGVTITEYIQQTRISKAKELLKKNNLKIHDIAAMTGFESPAYFARIFRKVTNKTPQEYRDSLVTL